MTLNASLTAVIILAVAGLTRGQDGLVGARHPALSADGQQIAFSYQGDIWIVGADGGPARRVSNHVAYDAHPQWSPDGQRIAFASRRFGKSDVFLLEIATGKIRRLTWHGGRDLPCAFTPDGESLVIETERRSRADLYLVDLNGGLPRPLLETLWHSPYGGSFAPDGKKLVFGVGRENLRWWRRGYRGANASEVWLLDRASGSARSLVDEDTNAHWPAFDRDGDGVIFVSERETGVKNVWRFGLEDGGIQPITRFPEHDVSFLSVATDAGRAVFERDFGIWRLELETGRCSRLVIEAASETKSGPRLELPDAKLTEFSVSPDGRKLATVFRGEIFASSANGGHARNLTRSSARDRDLDWGPESRRIVFVSDADGGPEVYIVNAASDAEPRRLTSWGEDVRQPRFSADGRWVAYFRGTREIRLVQPDGRNDVLLVKGAFGGINARSFAWSPDSRWIAAVVMGNGNRDLVAIDVRNGAITKLSDSAWDEVGPVWSPDGKSLLFRSNRSGHRFPEFSGQWDIYRLHLVPPPPRFAEDELDSLFAPKPAVRKRQSTKRRPAPPRTEIRIVDFDVQTERVLSTPGDESELVLVSDGEPRLVFVSDTAGREELWTLKAKGGKRDRLRRLGGEIDSPADLQVSGSSIFFRDRRGLGRIELPDGKSKRPRIDHRLEVDRVGEYRQMLAEIHYTLDHGFYDPKLHGTDWVGVYEGIREALLQVREDADFRDYANVMIGRLNASHTGIRDPVRTPKNHASGHLGLDLEFRGDGVFVTDVLAGGPCSNHGDGLEVGDRIAALDGEVLTRKRAIWSHLTGKVGRRVKVTVESRGGQGVRELAVKPISSNAARELRRKVWVGERRRRVVEGLSGRAAYIHMAAMGKRDLDRFLLELERDAVPREGLLLDLRWNRGGNVHDRVLQALTKPVYARWRIRGLGESLQSTFGFADKPVVMLVNQDTLSDGEMTASGFKTLERGPVVGTATYGWLIFTRDLPLVNGSRFRLPFLGCYTLAGENLETSGVSPDIVVPSNLADELAGRDPQLDRAIKRLRTEIDQRRKNRLP